MKDKSSMKKQGQSEANTSTMSEGEKLLMRLEAQGYSTDMIGQGFVMHLPSAEERNTSYTSWKYLDKSETTKEYRNINSNTAS